MSKVRKAIVDIELANLEGRASTDNLVKARNVKYYKREGSPGNYKYYYTKEEYEKAKGATGDIDTGKKEDPDTGKVDIKPMTAIDKMSPLDWNYGKGMSVKAIVGRRAKDFLTAVFEFRAANPPKGKFGEDTFSADRILHDKNTAAYLHGVPKQAWKEYQNTWDKGAFKKKWGQGIYSRLRTHEAYLSLKTSRLVGGNEYSIVDLSDFTRLVQLQLKY